MHVLGYSGLHDSVPFKRHEFPGLSERHYRIAQGFDSAAALVNGSGIVAAAAEERFSGDKQTGDFPAGAIAYCLAAAGLEIGDLDFVAHAFRYSDYQRHFEATPDSSRYYQKVLSPTRQLTHLSQRFPAVAWEGRFVAVPHHLAHAASAWHGSGMPEALILVSDGMGEVHSATIAVGRDGVITVLRQIPASHSLGILYGVGTLYLGFFMGLDEYKVMGLAPYGDRRRYFDRMMAYLRLNPDGTYAIPLLSRDVTSLDKETHAGVLEAIEADLGPARQPDEEITQHHMDVAAGLQAVLETCQLHVLRHFRRETGLTNLCMAGGVALNCSANGVIRRSRLFDRLFVQPAAGDDGTALGAALYVKQLHEPDPHPRRIALPLWGPGYHEERIDQSVGSVAGAQRYDDTAALLSEVAGLLEGGAVVGWFDGRMEFGPRALGSRSILADPRHAGMRDRINALVKKREEFRPFAPIVTAEAASRFFEIVPGDEETYAHMLLIAPVRPEYRDGLPAITHVDGTARVQTVFREYSPRLWELLVEFERRTGFPILLNTSFNVKGQPIVCSPEEAVDTYRVANLDALVLEHWLIAGSHRAPGAGAAAGRTVATMGACTQG